jgi:hypothetical protein
MRKAKIDKGFGEQYTSEFMRILVSEIVPALRSHNIPVNNDTKRAFMAGAALSQSLGIELMNQKLMDLGFDPRLDPTISQSLPFSKEKRKTRSLPK